MMGSMSLVWNRIEFRFKKRVAMEYILTPVVATYFIREPKALTTAVTATSQVEHQKLMVIGNNTGKL
jgi:hypothetical protein